jgi:acyl dehydratase
MPAPEDAVRFVVPGDTGRAYARVSGDWNPHHLWPITARPLGYRLPIAHGMWTLARLIGLLPEELDTTVGQVAATFHRPVFMPGTVAARVAPDGDAWALDAWSPERGTPQLRGTFRPL